MHKNRVTKLLALVMSVQLVGNVTQEHAQIIHRDRSIAKHAQRAARIQAVRNTIIIDYPAMLAHKKYHILEWLTWERADDQNIPYPHLQQDLPSYYVQYSNDDHDLPESITLHESYMRYNSK